MPNVKELPASGNSEKLNQESDTINLNGVLLSKELLEFIRYKTPKNKPALGDSSKDILELIQRYTLMMAHEDLEFDPDLIFCLNDLYEFHTILDNVAKEGGLV